MDMNNLADGTTSNADDTAGQSKSLIANVYSSDGSNDPDPYKQLDDWDVSEEDIRLAYEVTSGSDGLVRQSLKRLTQSGSHEEWYTQMQVALAHRIAGLLGQDQLPDGREVEGAVPVMEQVSIDGDDIMDYLRANPEYVSELDEEELAELASRTNEEPAAPEA